MNWSDAWVWYAGAILLGILELIAPGYILLGFALSAAVVGTLFVFGGGLSAYLATSLPITLVLFAALALVIWIVLRQLFGTRKGQVKIWETDINDD